ncbi:MAG TPA: alpha/beta fold hydrolase [Thermoleophilaceae bacterium]|nr:alpha/beta fold hydrolase [Thermoleophilaceae bacterium]
MSRRPRHPGLYDAKGRELPHTLVDVQGVPTYVVDAGEGPPVLLIHGYGDTADGWRRVVPGLLERHRVLAVDVPPFGRSADPHAPRLLDFYKPFFPELLERLGVERATVIGHSLGGAIALHLTLQRPDLVDRLGLVAPAGLGKAPPWWWHALAGYGRVWKTALSVPSPVTPVLIKQGMTRFLDWRLFHDPRQMRETIDHLVRMHGAPRDFDRLLAAGRCCIDSYTGTLLEDSAAIDVPRWLVWGRHDGLVPSEHAHTFRDLHPDAEVHVFDDCGHYPHIELPGRFNRLLRDWMVATGASRSLRAA